MLRVTIIVGASLLLLPLQEGWQKAEQDFSWEFPRDHWAHPDFRTEWWYQTGQLQDTQDPEHRFGYQFTFFRIGILPDVPAVASSWAANSVIMGHGSVVDFSTGKHVFTEVVYRATELLGAFNPPGDSLVAWSRGPGGNDQPWTLTWNGRAFDITMSNRWAGVGFSLQTTPGKPRIFQGPNGFSAKNAAGTAASMYYSFTRLNTTGTLTFDGREYEVAGTSWMDKEFGSDQLSQNQIGWDWFSLQFTNGSEAMLYFLRNESGTDHAHITTVDARGNTAYPAPETWVVEPTDQWRSPQTSAEYPSRWTVTAGGIPYDVKPVVADQENVSTLIPGLYYWEGAVEVFASGQLVGRGYVELTGYGDSSLPALSGN